MRDVAGEPIDPVPDVLVLAPSLGFIAESLERKEVWERVADACRAVVSFEVMGVSVFLPGDRVRVHLVPSEPSGPVP